MAVEVVTSALGKTVRDSGSAHTFLEFVKDWEQKQGLAAEQRSG